ncbi:DUF3817 domain-containing protein [Streptomyces caatingaensis]|uniref:Membrane protein n=1 Tax=Streptomyces caatingaensis TaxID=1678637 RepID=A0A0K9XC25_9ACTN|nr:DUF3817 domain-containing protein [Streptomyces caatingaensis]KNB50974.1 membrane protein [Streptomyces caatingaensis]
MKKAVLTRYRALAYITGVLLLLLTLGMIAKYGLGMDGVAGPLRVVAIAHGWLFVVYLVLAFDMGSKAKWSFGKLAWVLIAGTIPTAAFFVERKATRELEPLLVDGAAAPAKV